MSSKSVLQKLPVITLFLLAGILRFMYLGYSDYQGDEIKALYISKEIKSASFFLEQRKGPAQFLVTAGLRDISNNYRNRLIVRLPFALAGFGSVIVFYYLVKDLFNSKVAFYSSIFIATNGFFVAFSRIVQYQSLVIFFGLLAVYLTKKYTDSLNWRFLILAFLSWALSILSHYDGIFFAPIIFGVLASVLKKAVDKTIRVRMAESFIVSFLLFVVLVGIFYIPFVLNISKDTADYWAGRISGDVSGKISSSRYLFSVYQPIYALHIYVILGTLGFLLTLFILAFKLFPNFASKIIRYLYKPQVFGGAHSGFSISILLALLIWFIIPFVFLEIVVSIPGTHIYTYLVPTFLFMGFALFHTELISFKLLEKSSYVFKAGVWLVIIFLFLQSYTIFVDHGREYPWQNKKFLLWELTEPRSVYHLSLFGFPYYRHWDEISDFIKKDFKSDYYSTNERTTISGYYIKKVKDSSKMGYYIAISHPQTLIHDISNERVIKYASENVPVAIYKNNTQVVSQVYLLPKNGLPIPEEQPDKSGLTGDEN